MQRKKKNKFDSTGIGFLIGLFLPLLIFFTVWFFKETNISFAAYLKSMWQMQALLKLISLCVFANVAAFWIFIRMKFEKAARGVLGATILYAFAVLISRAI